MSDLVTRAQTVLLAQLLHVTPDKIAHLEHLGAAKLHELRERISAVLFDDNADVFKMITLMVPVVPLRIAMPIIQRIVPPEMAGRAAGAVAIAHPKKISGAMALLKPEYAAQAAPFIDPRAVREIAHLAPVGPVVDIANEILRRGDYTTGGLFVDAATEELIIAIEQGVKDDEGLIRSAAYVYDAKIMSQIVRMIIDHGTTRIRSMILTVTNGPTDLRLAGLSAFSRLDRDLIGQLGDILFGEVEPDVIAELLRSFVAEGVLGDLLEFVKNLSPYALDEVAKNPVVSEPEFLDTAVRTAAEHPDDGIWRGLVGVVSRTAPEVQSGVLERVLVFGNDLPQRIAGLAAEQDLWVPLLDMLNNQSSDLQDRIARSWAPLLRDRKILDDAVTAIASHPDGSAWKGLLSIGERTDLDLQTEILEALLDRHEDLAIRISAVATEQDLWPALLRMLARQNQAQRDRVIGQWKQHLRAEDRAIVAGVVNKEGLKKKLSALLD